MALKLLNPGYMPLGQFDGLDSDYLTLKGGEVVTFASVTSQSQAGVFAAGLDTAAFDQFDGYVENATLNQVKRPVITRKFDGTTTATGLTRPLMLADEGVLGYGTLFGTVVGGVVGQTSYGINSVVPASALLGPHTAAGSGKVTCWDKPGLYAVSLDAVDTTAQTGLVTTNTGLTVGASLSITPQGLLTPYAASAINNPQMLQSNGPQVGHFVEFTTNGALVTTPNYLVAALNSPSGNVTSVGPRSMAFVTIYFAPQLT